MTGFLGHELGQLLLKKGHKLGTLARNVATSDRPIASNTEINDTWRKTKWYFILLW